ncbi:MAG: hypothetical protein K0R10_2357 [Alphaproteobacteria bacterium]|nr:hypothetical protein [Alphaproteobacteria bacterium]
MPTGAWSLIVDENGDQVVTRQPRNTDMLARPAVAYLYGGTQPEFKMEKSPDQFHNLQGVIDYECRAQRNKEYLDKAVFLLSQTDDGRRLLDLARHNKFTLLFDNTRVAEEGAVGLCDFSGKVVPLAEGRSPAEVALTLKHELQHMEDMSKGVTYSANDTPQTARMAERALEGNARVSEAIAAAEMLLGSPQGPEQQFRTPALARNFWHKNQPMAEAAQAALPQAKKADWKAFASKVFPAYFKQVATLEFYDARYAEYAKSVVPDVTPEQMKTAKGQQAIAMTERLFSQNRSAEEIAGAVTLRGAAYLNPAVLLSEAGQAVTEKAIPVLMEAKAKLLKILPGAATAASLDAKASTQKPDPRLPNPYKPFLSELTGPDTFASIVMPNRIDGGHYTTGERHHAVISAFMEKEVGGMKSGRTELDRMNYSIGTYLHSRGGYGNQRGLVSDLVEAGLRAPVGAFPSEYLQDLYSRMYGAAREGVTGDRSPLSKQELKLISHWQDMKDRGMDPVWISAEMKTQSYVGNDKMIESYAGYLVRGLKSPAVTTAVPAAQTQARRA